MMLYPKILRFELLCITAHDLTFQAASGAALRPARSSVPL